MAWYVELVTKGKREVAFYSQDFDTRAEAEEYAQQQESLGFTTNLKQS